MITEKVTNLGFIVIKNTCQVYGFTLMIYSSSILDANKINPSLLSDYELQSSKNKPLKNIGDEINYEEKLDVSSIGEVMDVNIYITKEDTMGTSIEIKYYGIKSY